MNGEKEFKNLFPESHYISKYLKYAKSLTDAYPEYHFAGALNHLSVTANGVIRIDLSPDELKTNIWTVSLGLSTISRKSTSVKKGRQLLQKAGLDRKILSDDATPEAFIDELQEEPQSTFIAPEFGHWLSKTQKKYQGGFMEMLCELFDCPEEKTRSLRRQKITVKQPYISLHVALVPSQMADYANTTNIDSGFLPRFLVLFPERQKLRKDRRYLTETDKKLEGELVSWLKLAYAFTLKLKNAGKTLNMVPTKEALEAQNKWEKEFEEYIQGTEIGKDFAPFYGRACDYVLKLAALFELGALKYEKDDQGNVIVNDFDKIRENSGYSGYSNISHFSHFSQKEERLDGLLKDQNTNSTKITKIISKKAIETAIFYIQEMFLPYALKLFDLIKDHEKDPKITKLLKIAERIEVSGVIDRSEWLTMSNLIARDFNSYTDTLVQRGQLMPVKGGQDGKKQFFKFIKQKKEKITLPSIEKFEEEAGKREVK